MEPLEPRIAPAAVFSYTDLDGDFVTITTSKGTNAQLAAVLTFSGDPAGPRKLELADFSGNPFVFAGTNVTIDAQPAGGGDGLVKVGRISGISRSNLPFIDLGKIKIDGDIGEIDAGDENRKTPGIKSLAVVSIGEETPANFTADGTSEVFGAIGKVMVSANVAKDSKVQLDAAGSLQIDGTLSGRITVTNKLGSAIIGTIAGDDTPLGIFKAGTGPLSVIGSVTVGPIIANGNGGTLLLTGKIGKVSVESVAGGTFLGVGVNIEGSVKSLTFGTISRGNLAFGTPVYVIGDIGSLTVLEDGSDAGLYIDGKVGKANFASIGSMAPMIITKNLGPLKVTGDILGTPTESVSIQVGGNIKSIDVTGSVSFASIQAGIANLPGNIVSTPDVRIGSIQVGGNWTAASLSAGVENFSFVAGGPDKPRIIAAIKSIVIEGGVFGTISSADDFRFVAQAIGSMRIGSTVIPLTKGPANDLIPRLLGGTNDVTVREVGFSWPNPTL